MPRITKFQYGREDNDCAIASLAMYLGVSYEDVLRATTQVLRKTMGKEGIRTGGMKLVARQLGFKLKFSKRFNRTKTYGIILFDGHAAILRNGLVIDPDGEIWDLDEFTETYEHTIEGVLR